MRFKVQTAADDAGQVVAYVDARVVYDRLDLVCGERWWPRFGPLPRALFVDERSEAWCRAKYECWLDERGAAQFGEPLDHGHAVSAEAADSEPAGGDGEPAQAAGPAPTTPPLQAAA